MTSLTILQKERSDLKKTLTTTEKLLSTAFNDETERKRLQARITELEQFIIDADLAIDLFKESKSINKKIVKLEEKAESEEEESDLNKWSAFKKALAVYESTQMCFHKNQKPMYFYKKTYIDKDIKTNEPLPPKTELLMFGPNSFSENWPVELEGKYAQRFLKHMIHGETIAVKNPDADQVESYKFTKRVYTKLGNTRHIPDDETFNVIDFSSIMKPTGTQDECPFLIRQLLLAITGNVETFDENEKSILTKPENLYWYEKWLYGVLVADIGNNMLSMPVIFGSGKVGKNAMFDKIFPRVFGSEMCFTGLWEAMDGSFTGFKLGKVFIYLDEIPARDEWNKLKSLTGSPSELVKVKYGPEFSVENTVAMAIGSNQDVFPLPMEDGKQMTRISPMRTDKRSNFAENTFKWYERIQQGLLAKTLVEQGIDITGIENDAYELGDKFLRTNNDLWCSEEQVQQFLNYLHGKFKDEKYTLSPLRGQDWQEILKSRPNPIAATIDYIAHKKPEIITITELYEIYQVVIGDKKNTQFIKQQNHFSIAISPLLADLGYSKLTQHRVFIEGTSYAVVKQIQQGNTEKVITQTTAFCLPDAEIKNHVQSIDKYIIEERLGNSVARRLIY